MTGSIGVTFKNVNTVTGVVVGLAMKLPLTTA